MGTYKSLFLSFPAGHPAYVYCREKGETGEMIRAGKENISRGGHLIAQPILAKCKVQR